MAEGDRKKRGYCKASWYNKDKNGDLREEVLVVPRDWITKGDLKIYYPPKHADDKRMIITMHPRPDESLSQWQVFPLVSCSRTFQSLLEADEADTGKEVESDSSVNEQDSDLEDTALPTMQLDASDQDMDTQSPPSSRALSPDGSQCSQRSQKRQREADKFYATIGVKRLINDIGCEVKVRTFLRC